jgi:hypothetical protein
MPNDVKRGKPAPQDAQRHALLGLAATSVEREEAIREGERGVALAPLTKDADMGTYVQQQLVCVYILVGEPGKALDQLEPLLRILHYLSPTQDRLLRSNPCFQKRVTGAKQIWRSARVEAGVTQRKRFPNLSPADAHGALRWLHATGKVAELLQAPIDILSIGTRRQTRAQFNRQIGEP